jgi:hypothetical protein
MADSASRVRSDIEAIAPRRRGGSDASQPTATDAASVQEDGQGGATRLDREAARERRRAARRAAATASEGSMESVRPTRVPWRHFRGLAVLTILNGLDTPSQPLSL